MWVAHIALAPQLPPVPIIGFMTDEQARYSGEAIEIARMPGVAARLRAAHVPGPDGRCRGCPSALTIAPIWPCRLRDLADRAATLIAASGPMADRRP